jgi:hypothetical protein
LREQSALTVGKEISKPKTHCLRQWFGGIFFNLLKRYVDASIAANSLG